MQHLPTSQSHKIGIFLSAFLLAMLMIYWPDIFLYAKVVKNPSWVYSFDPMLIIFLTLIPALATADNWRQGINNIVLLSMLITLIPITIYVSRYGPPDQYLFKNLLFQYVWIFLTSFLIPISSGIIVRLAFDNLISKVK
ncbi:hypothetical protein [Iodobacter fluviatilis]|uniref:Uncharacterized protein n=1 Tax=Iodobacter fluviatilis TaxID=537 RepID=A0A377Q4C2_9NEIS|nr:hypothetical protein [Iodobacter fluviatilis]TCU90543.1 hypothetical protein EV682_101577 [Iodobacter fluviatilis]STQ89570.1 Uncharacterised protein [Iodobacter fluviatilis]